jgi:hypothetical protein
MALRGYAAFMKKVNAAPPGTFTKFDVRHGSKPCTLCAIQCDTLLFAKTLVRIVLTTLCIAFLYAFTGTLISLPHWTFGYVIYSLVMTFGFILIPLLLCVCIFHILLAIYRATKREPPLAIQMLTLWTVYNLFLFLISLPDFIRHQHDKTYFHYRSFVDYFLTNMLEAFIIATSFSIAIPLLDRFLTKEKHMDLGHK